jgi:hypothetical protein
MYTSSDNVTFANVYQQTITTSTGFTNGSKIPSVGAYNTVAGEFEGKIYRMTFANSIGGAPVVDFNPNQYTGANTWTSTTSEVWTVNRTGAGLADVVQTTAASQPLLLVHSGVNYWFGSGVSGNYCSTPNAAANSNNGNKEIILNLDITNLSAQTELINKDDVGSNRGWRIFLTSTRFITVLASTDLSAYISNPPTSDVALPLNFKGFVKITFTFFSGSLNVLFFTSSDGITYTQLGTQRSKLGNNLINTNAELAIGIVPLIGVSDKIKIFRATLSNTIGGAPVVDFNPNQYNAATSQTQWTSSTGEVWTINTGTATTGYKGVLVDRTIMQGDGVDDLLINAIVRPNILTQYLATNTYTNDNSGNAVLVDSNSGSYLNSIVAFTSIVGNIMNGFASDLTKAKSANVVYLVTTSNNSGVKNAISVNNGTETTNAYTPALSGNGISILSRSSGGTKANALIRTYLLSNAQDDSTVRTAMYNIIRSINNSAF